MSGTVIKHDWESLKKDFDKSNMLLRDFTSLKQISYSYASKKFSEMNAIENAELQAMTTRKLARLGPKAVDKIGQLLDSEDENVLTKVTFGIMDRTGNSPQAATINISNVNATQIQIPPMLASDNADDLRSMLGGGTDEGDK